MILTLDTQAKFFALLEALTQFTENNEDIDWELKGDALANHEAALELRTELEAVLIKSTGG